ncbi:hypothetical protein [Scytonema hofmannii]|uniref:hypothetical protein n=1 Tax=Scytonema hofmannii TaxID=34078 RepID=UPI00034D27A8|nr:hypothetical protein [Scytonema hofmannii]
MPSRKWQFRILDIVQAIAAIQQRVDGMSLEDFRGNETAIINAYKERQKAEGILSPAL